MIVPGNLYSHDLSAARHKVMDPKREIAVFEIIRKGGPGQDVAIRMVVDSNLKFVVSVARQYTNQGIPFPDLINEGALGMMRAARKFEPAQGNRFITYAVWWVRQAMTKAIADQASNIKTPAMCVPSGKLKAAKAKLKTAQDSDKTESIERATRKVDAAAEGVASLQRLRKTESMDEMGGDGWQVPDPAMDPETAADQWDAARTVRRALERLKPVERAVIRRSFGLDQGEAETLEEVGHRFGVTRERIRQIKTLAMMKMKKHLEKERSKWKYSPGKK